MTYNLFAHGVMVSDTARVDGYVRALSQVVKPGSVVLDIGTGTGIFALVACQLGARRVYAIEPDDIIELAREIAEANGFADRLVFVQNVSTRVSLPERADVIVSDLRGLLPMFDGHIPSIIDARQRFLAPGGTLIPQRDTVWLTVVQGPELYAQQVAVWEEKRHGLDMRPARRFAVSTWRKGRVAREQFLVEPRCGVTLDYASVESPDVSADVTWTSVKPGIAHGLIVWFDMTLVEGVRLSNSPLEPELAWGSAFFPWPEPVALAVDDTISVALRADFLGRDYVWRWETSILERGDPRRVKAKFRQSDFFGAPLSAARLRRRDASHVPTLNEEARIDRLILELADGRTSLNEIAERLLASFPARFTGLPDALTCVGELTQRYAREGS